MGYQDTRNILRETSTGIYSVSIKDHLLQGRKVFLTGIIDGEKSASLLQQFIVLEEQEPGQPILFYINSSGGSVQDGLMVYDYLMSLKKGQLTTVCTGHADSMAGILMLAGDRRLIFRNGRVLLHDASFQSADFSGLKPAEIQERTDTLLKTCETLRRIISERTGNPIEAVTEKMKTDTVFSAEEALNFNICTELVEEAGQLAFKDTGDHWSASVPRQI